jgi:bifunctional non-homologous end joining protein LigD
MAAPSTRDTSPKDTSIGTYRQKRDFGRTPEPSPRKPGRAAGKRALRFVVQKHAARRLHWDFRLEHGGVLWSWAVPKGPSLDPHDKRLAVRTEDHPLDYADFHGEIPAGNYGAGTVDIWDEGTWEPLADPAAALHSGELKFRLSGQRLAGRFVLIRLRPRGNEKAENWLLIKEHDDAESAGTDAAALEQRPAPKPRRVPDAAKPAPVLEAEQASVPPRGKTAQRTRTAAAKRSLPAAIAVAEKPAAAPSRRAATSAPAPGPVRAALPDQQAPQLAHATETPPEDDGWISEVKFDGYRLLAWKDGAQVRLLTRNGLDWTHRLPEIAQAIAKLRPKTLLLDGELVALRPDGLSSFADLQAALAGEGDRGALYFYLFDLLHLENFDLRPCRLADRKAALERLSDWSGRLRYSDHLDGETARVRRQACAMGLEGIICKQADAPYHAGRGHSWLKLKCQGREEFLVLGATPPAGSREGFGALHLGFYDPQGALHYAGGVGTGFTAAELRRLQAKLEKLAAPAPKNLLVAGDPPDRAIAWVRPELVAEVQYTGFSGAGRVRHGVYLGLRDDKPPAEVVRDPPDPGAERVAWSAGRGFSGTIVRAAKPKRGTTHAAGEVNITHADKELWPGITKADLVAYWTAIADAALPGIAHRPLSLVRCPDGIDGQHFFQKHAHKGMPAQLHEAAAGGSPYVALSDAAGLVACAQIAAIELHSWGAAEADPLHADRIVLDLDPGDGVAFAEVVQAAHDVRKRLRDRGLESFCRTTGGKGLHVVAPLRPDADWDTVRAWCRDFARRMEAEEPQRFVSVMPKQKRRGHILVDWMRNGLGATAVASYSPRARPGAGVATPLEWREVTERLDPQAFTIGTIAARLKRRRRDAWEDFSAVDQVLPGTEGG